jgi:alpha-glucosidase (family GH31 glycosyl hydrolase)
LSGDFSRRAVLRGIGTSVAGLLFKQRFAVASPHQAATDAPGLELSLTAVSDRILRVIIAASDEPLDRLYGDGSLAARSWPKPMMQVSAIASMHRAAWGSRRIQVRTDPLCILVEEADGRVRQELIYDKDRVSFRCAEPIFGLGEGGHPFDRRGTTDDMHNGESTKGLDTFGARLPIPWLIGASGWGLFFHEPAGSFDLTKEVGSFQPHESARGLDIFLLLGDTPLELLRAWADLTGHPHLPPLWAFGYQQSHRTLASRNEVMREAKTFRERKLPCDALIYLGTGFCPSGWNTGHGSFTFNQEVFPDPAEMIRQLHQEHFKVVLHVVNPPENLHGKVTDTDVAASEPSDAANYWANHVPLDRIGVDGWWPDEGDPLPVASRLVRNEMYWEGERQTRPSLRPFALNRNGYAGMQRYGWLWSGDVLSTWETLAAQIMVGINVGLCGIPWWGTDTGGFVPTEEFTAELFLRWFQFSAFCPLFRSHGRTWKLRLPWGWNTGDYGPAEMSPEKAAAVLPKPGELHNPAVESICRKYLNARYRLLPYLYSAAAETHASGIPLMRALWLEYPNDARLSAISDTYMFGPDLLVAPVLEPDAKKRAVYLPQGDWWDFWTSERVAGGNAVSRRVDLETMPVYVRAGAILPSGPVKQFVTEASEEPVTLTVYPGADGGSVLYEDDGASFAYEQGAFIRTELRWTDASRTLMLKNVEEKTHPKRVFRVGLAGGTTREIRFDGNALKLPL